MRKRRCFLSFPEQDSNDAGALKSQKVIEGVNIRFSCETNSSFGIVNSGNIDVYNLNRTDTEFLTTSTAFWINRRRLVQLYAGYDDDVRLIMSGQILEAPPQGYPDMALHIRLFGDAKWQTTVIDVNKSDLKIVDLIDYVGSITDYPVNIPQWLRDGNEWLNKRLSHYSYTGTPMGLLQEIQDMLGGYNPSDTAFNIGVGSGVIRVSTSKKTENESVLLINKETGMIGLPSPTINGIMVKTLLNPDVAINDVIKLESERIPMCNGQYVVFEIKHEGELRSNQFYTTLHCRRQTPIGSQQGGEDGQG